MQPKVSVIIPVFQAEKDILRCSRSLFEQTLDEIEYIFIDDCSSDNSIAILYSILDEYPWRKPYVKILRQKENSGVSACRQLGLDNTSGQFIIHCDADDWVAPEMYKHMYEKAIVENAEIVCCDYWVDYGDSAEIVEFPDKFINRPSFSIAPIEGAVWNKLISSSLIKRCKAHFFEGINLGEDFGFVTLCRVMSKKNVVLHEPFYHYNQLNIGSITHNYTKKHFMQVIKLAERIDLQYKTMGLANDYVNELNFLKFQAKSFFIIYDSVLDLSLWRDTFPECSKYSMKYAYPLYVRIVGWLISNRLSPIAWCVLKLKKIFYNH